jgi:hypothetical protein
MDSSTSTPAVRPAVHPAKRPPLLPQATGLASSSTSSSATQPSKSDQVIYRIYLKTVGVLVEGRLTPYGGSGLGNGGKNGDKKKDKWVGPMLISSRNLLQLIPYPSSILHYPRWICIDQTYRFIDQSLAFNLLRLPNRARSRHCLSPSSWTRAIYLVVRR